MIITEPTEPEETGGEEAASEESESLTTSAVSSLPEESAAADAEKEIEKEMCNMLFRAREGDAQHVSSSTRC